MIGVASHRMLTIGHSGRSVSEFLEMLRPHGVEEIVDVRRYPGSRRNPQFGEKALSEALAETGIGYTHAVKLGGRRGRPSPESPNTGWRVESFQAYADHMADPEWQAALRDLEERAMARVVAAMCSEAVPWRCHRRLIADALVVRGWEVRHILGKNRTMPHQLQEFARVLPDGGLIYPAEDQ